MKPEPLDIVDDRIMRCGTVYLSGPIFGRSDGDCIAWRQMAKTVLPDVIDPMDFGDHRADWAEHVVEIVEKDKANIDRCDTLLVNADRVSIGTPMEILYGWQKGKQVVVVRNADLLGPWLDYHCHRWFMDLYEALAYLSGLERNEVKVRCVGFAYGASAPGGVRREGIPLANQAGDGGPR
jgi:hypothetical protein